MTLQEIFDKVKVHLLAQGKPAVDWVTSQCRYRAPDGLKCAVGCLITDEAYTPDIEGTVLPYSPTRVDGSLFPVIRALQDSGIDAVESGTTRHLLRELQRAHDEMTDCPDSTQYEPWLNKKLARVAKEFNLEA